MTKIWNAVEFMVTSGPPFVVNSTQVVTGLNADTVDGFHAADLGGGGGISDGDKGDVTVSSSGSVWTIDNGVVSLAKMANMATASLIYRKTAGSGAPEVNSLATLKTDLGLTGTNSGDQTLPTRASLGLDTTDSPQFAAINLGHASDTTITRVSAGVIAVEGVQLATGTGTASGTNTGDQTSVSGNAGTVTVADAGGDSTTWVLLGTAQTGSLSPATDGDLTFDATANVLRVGISTATNRGNVAINQTAARPGLTFTGAGPLGGSDVPDHGIGFWLTYNVDGNHQFVFGETDGFNTSATACFAFNFVGGIASIRGITGDGVYPLAINLGDGTSSYADVVIGNASLVYNYEPAGKLELYQKSTKVGAVFRAASSGSFDLMQWADNSGTAVSIVTITGNFGIRRTSASAYLHIGAGTATAGTAPLKLTSGTVNTAPEDGAIEFDGTHFYGSIGSTRYQLDQQGGLTQPQVMARGVFGGPF